MSHIKPLCWKEVGLGEKEALILVESLKVISNDEGVEIAVLDSLVKRVSTNLKLFLIGKFVSFYPLIEMV